MTVTCRRSDVSKGEGGAGPNAAGVKQSLVKRAPQFVQNVERAALLWAHSRQRTGSGAPQLLQNRLPSKTSAVQLGHCIAKSPKLLPTRPRANLGAGALPRPAMGAIRRALVR